MRLHIPAKFNDSPLYAAGWEVGLLHALMQFGHAHHLPPLAVRISNKEELADLAEKHGYDVTFTQEEGARKWCDAQFRKVRKDGTR